MLSAVVSPPPKPPPRARRVESELAEFGMYKTLLSLTLHTQAHVLQTGHFFIFIGIHMVCCTVFKEAQMQSAPATIRLEHACWIKPNILRAKNKKIILITQSTWLY